MDDVNTTHAVQFQPVLLSSREGHEEACLVLVNSAVAAILVKHPEGVSEDTHAWYLEAGFPPHEVEGVIFPSLDSAEAWIRGRLLEMA